MALLRAITEPGYGAERSHGHETAAAAPAILRSVDPRDRVFGPIATRDFEVPDGVVSVSVDFGDLVRKLVLAEQFVLQSVLLAEFPLLIRKFGYDGVKELLESGRVRIFSDATTIAQTGQSGQTRCRLARTDSIL